MTPEKMIAWIDKASFEDLLRKWRFAKIGDPFFQGEVGDHYNLVFHTKRMALTGNEYPEASKRVGWKPGTGGSL